MDSLKALMESDLMKNVLADMDKEGAGSARRTFTVNGMPHLLVQVVIGPQACMETEIAMRKVEERNFQPESVITLADSPKILKGFNHRG